MSEWMNEWVTTSKVFFLRAVWCSEKKSRKEKKKPVRQAELEKVNLSTYSHFVQLRRRRRRWSSMMIDDTTVTTADVVVWLEEEKRFFLALPRRNFFFSFSSFISSAVCEYLCNHKKVLDKEEKYTLYCFFLNGWIYFFLNVHIY